MTLVVWRSSELSLSVSYTQLANASAVGFDSQRGWKWLLQTYEARFAARVSMEEWFSLRRLRRRRKLSPVLWWGVRRPRRSVAGPRKLSLRQEIQSRWEWRQGYRRFLTVAASDCSTLTELESRRVEKFPNKERIWLQEWRLDRTLRSSSQVPRLT